MFDLAWSPDGTAVVAGSIDNEACLYDVQAGRPVVSPWGTPHATCQQGTCPPAWPSTTCCQLLPALPFTTAPSASCVATPYPPTTGASPHSQLRHPAPGPPHPPARPPAPANSPPRPQARFSDHKHYIQGVAWDPLGQFVVTQSADRSVRVYTHKPPAAGKHRRGGGGGGGGQRQRQRQRPVVQWTTP
jgi:hypothetical protein